jgi:L-ascorbate metabolism protein UlaG (beta-lactamase superfamily)
MSINIKYLGHSSFLISIDKKKILTDPYFNNNPIGKNKRLIPSYYKVNQLPKIDSILISHEHSDCFDIESINYLIDKYNPKIISHHSILNKVNSPDYKKVPIDEYETKNINDISFTAYPAHHPTSFYPLSYIIKSKTGKSIYFAGDTLMTKDHESIKADIAILPIGGNRTMDLITAIRVSKKMKPKYIIPMHYNTFKDIKRNPHELTYKLDKTNYNINTVILDIGKNFKYK